jgi:TonB family protein
VIPLELAVLKATVLMVSAVLLLRLPRTAPASARSAVCVLALGCATLAALLSLWPVAPALPVDLPAFRFVTDSAPRTANSTAIPDLAIPAIWLAGAALLALRYAVGIRVVRRTLADSLPLPFDSTWQSLASDLAPDIEVRVADVASPLACGLIRPTILVPTDALEWPATQIRPVLLHELAHVRRRDLRANAVATLTTVLFWFHPLVWMLAARLHREQELACDDAVLSQGVIARSYAEMLVESARRMSGDILFGCAMTGRAGAFHTRVAHMLDSTRPRLPRRRAVALTSAAFLAAALVLSAFRPVAAAAPEQVYRIGKDVAAPKLVKKVEPEYTQAARDAKVQGTVLLIAVIGTDGRARDLKVDRHLDPGLDANAVKAIEQWQFEPGKRKGKPVAVQAHIEVNFKLN